jgi:hypothetical protein
VYDWTEQVEMLVKHLNCCKILVGEGLPVCFDLFEKSRRLKRAEKKRNRKK